MYLHIWCFWFFSDKLKDYVFCLWVEKNPLLLQLNKLFIHLLGLAGKYWLFFSELMKNTQQTIQKYTHLIVYFCILLDSCVVLLLCAYTRWSSLALLISSQISNWGQWIQYFIVFVGIYPCYRIWCVPKHWTTVKEKQIMLHLFWQILQWGCDSRSEGMILFASQFSYSLEKNV